MSLQIHLTVEISIVTQRNLQFRCGHHFFLLICTVTCGVHNPVDYMQVYMKQVYITSCLFRYDLVNILFETHLILRKNEFPDNILLV